MTFLSGKDEYDENEHDEDYEDIEVGPNDYVDENGEVWTDDGYNELTPPGADPDEHFSEDDRVDFEPEGWELDGRDDEGYDIDGYDEDGYDRDGRDAEGYDRDGIDEWGDKREENDD